MLNNQHTSLALTSLTTYSLLSDRSYTAHNGIATFVQINGLC